MSSTRNSDPRALITLGDLTGHFEQDSATGQLKLSEAVRNFVLDSYVPPPATSEEVAFAVKTDPNNVVLQDMAGNPIGYAIQ